MSTVPRGIFLPPQPPIVREIVAKPRHIYAYASHPRILDQQNHQQQLVPPPPYPDPPPPYPGQQSNQNQVSQNSHYELFFSV